MHREAYSATAAIEQSMWWHRARRQLVLTSLKNAGVGPGGRLLDFGCGTGDHLSLLQSFAPELVVGVDRSPEAMRIAKKNVGKSTLVMADVANLLPINDEVLDGCIILNVLYHKWISSELVALREVRRVLKPGAPVVITEPAMPVLRRNLDDVVLSERRFNVKGFVNTVEAAGFDVQHISYFTMTGVPIVLLLKAIEKLRNVVWATKAEYPAEFSVPNRYLNAALFYIAKWENWLIHRGVRLPFGVNLVCVAVKPHAGSYP
jgi:ubiquinone/menaquinone biosynthesis C-methylase UbiE